MADPRPHGVPPAAVQSRTAPARTGLFLFLGLLLLGGILWWALAADDRDDDVAVYQTTMPGQRAVTRTEVDRTTTTADAVASSRAPMVVETPATETDLSLGTTATVPPPAAPETADSGTMGAGVDVTDPGTTTETEVTDEGGVTEPTTQADDVTAGAPPEPAAPGGSVTTGTSLGTTAGGEVSLSALEQDAERFVGQTVTTTVTVRQLETLRGFWAESGTDRVFAVMPSTSNERVDQELLEGQQIRLTATVVDADDAADMPELADMVDDDGRFLSGEEAVLRVSGIEILEESATR